jgi:hypothetical protein
LQTKEIEISKFPVLEPELEDGELVDEPMDAVVD